MSCSLRPLLGDRIDVCNQERDIRQLEDELAYHQQCCKFVEETIVEQQKNLLDLQKTLKHRYDGLQPVGEKNEDY